MLHTPPDRDTTDFKTALCRLVGLDPEQVSQVSLACGDDMIPNVQYTPAGAKNDVGLHQKVEVAGSAAPIGHIGSTHPQSGDELQKAQMEMLQRQQAMAGRMQAVPGQYPPGMRTPRG